MFTEEKDILIAILMANGFVLLVTTVYFLFAYYMVKKNRQLKLDKLKAALFTSEEARQNIATQLHNDLGPTLATINMKLELVKIKGPEMIDDCQQTVSRSIRMIRQMTKELSPFGNLHITLKMALDQYVSELMVISQLQCNVEELDVVQLEPILCNQIYRIVQEIILNTFKHSKAKILNIELSRVRDGLLIRTSDDGIGFDVGERVGNLKLGYGLKDMYNRVSVLGGEISCKSDQFGTKYVLLIPVD